MSCFPSFTEMTSLRLLIYWIMKFTQKHLKEKWTRRIYASCSNIMYFILRKYQKRKERYINTWIHSRCSSLAGTICNNWRVYHDANLIKRAVGIHFTRLIYVWITTLFSAEISRRSGSAMYLSLFITNTIIAAVDVLNPLIFLLCFYK